jgi:hypothetical protein
MGASWEKDQLRGGLGNVKCFCRRYRGKTKWLCWQEIKQMAKGNLWIIEYL